MFDRPPPSALSRRERLSSRGGTAVRLAVLLAVLIACNGERSTPASASRRHSPGSTAAKAPARAAEHAAAVVAESAASEVDSADSTLGAPGAVSVLRAYYTAINAHRFHDAYHFWSDEGAASNQTLEEFARGYDGTLSTAVFPATPGRIEGAAGSRYIEIPVTIEAESTGGKHQRFAGRYVLRRVVVPGATSDERSWHIYTAQIHAVP